MRRVELWIRFSSEWGIQVGEEEVKVNHVWKKEEFQRLCAVHLPHPSPVPWQASLINLLFVYLFETESFVSLADLELLICLDLLSTGFGTLFGTWNLTQRFTYGQYILNRISYTLNLYYSLLSRRDLRDP